MGRKGTSYCGDTNKQQVNRGAWSPEEDKVLTDYVQLHGEGKWGLISKRAGLKRCGKSCRLRWLNYLKPDIKRGNISSDEEDLIIRLHKLLGNRWSLIAGRLPGRTDNEIKNYWNTYLRKKIENKTNHNKLPGGNNSILKLELPATSKDTLAVVDPSKSPHTITNKPKSVRCSKVTIPSNNTNLISTSWENQNPSSSNPQLDGQDCSASFLKDFDFEDLLIPFEDCHFNRNFGDYSIGIGYNENWKIDDFFLPDQQALDFSSFSKFRTWNNN